MVYYYLLEILSLRVIRRGYFVEVFIEGACFFWQGFAWFFNWSFLLCKRLFVALVILKSVVVCVGFVRSGENKKETDLGCLIPNLHTVGGWIVFI